MNITLPTCYYAATDDAMEVVLGQQIMSCQAQEDDCILFNAAPRLTQWHSFSEYDGME